MQIGWLWVWLRHCCHPWNQPWQQCHWREEKKTIRAFVVSFTHYCEIFELTETCWEEMSRCDGHINDKWYEKRFVSRNSFFFLLSSIWSKPNLLYFWTRNSHYFSNSIVIRVDFGLNYWFQTWRKWMIFSFELSSN